MSRIFETVNIMTTGPDIKFSEMGAEAGFVRNRNFIRFILLIPVIKLHFNFGKLVQFSKKSQSK